MSEQDLVEKVALRLYNRKRGKWNMRSADYLGANKTPQCEECREEARAAISVIREALIEPSEAQWNGLARDLIMWHDMANKTPRALFDHLTMLRREIPDWLRNEPEMQALDHVPSKGTRAVLIYRAMIAASPIGEK